MKCSVYISIVLILLSGKLLCQLVTNNTSSANTLVNEVLAGEGVQISNVTYVGAASALGEFFGASSNIGLDHGIILSTGSVLDVVNDAGSKNGPVGPNNNAGASTAYNTPGDVDLNSLVQGGTADAAVLEFDFVPEGDSINFRYVFASDEYIEWSKPTDKFNDVFGFFISGPGISGKQNMALLPDKVTSVSIRSVNDWNNSQYFNDNGNGVSGSQATDASVVNYDGFTDVFVASSKVTPCQTYHLKMVIADNPSDDPAFDSGVFLEANSLSSVPAFEIDQQANFSPNGSNTELFENCVHQGNLSITRKTKLAEILTVSYAISGSAINGIDYELLSGEVTFGEGEISQTIEVIPITDALVEGTELVLLKFDNPDVCDLAVDSLLFTYEIKDRPPLEVSITSYDSECENDEVTISADADGGVLSYTYNWLSPATGSSQTTIVSPVTTSSYTYEISDVCGQKEIGEVTVNVQTYDPILPLPMNDTIIRCRGEQVSFTAGATGGAGEYTYLWQSGKKSKKVNNVILSDTTFSVSISDKCGNTIFDEVEVILTYPPFSVNISEDTVYCFGDTATVVGTPVGGVPPYSSGWDVGSTNPYSFEVTKSKMLTYSSYDSCGILPAKNEVLIESQRPTASFNFNASIPEPDQIIGFFNFSAGATKFYWDFDNGLRDQTKEPTTVYEKVGRYKVKLSVTDELNCSDTVVKELFLRHPLYYFLPSSFSPNGDGINDFFKGKGIGVNLFSMTIFDRSGAVLFSTNDVEESWDGNTRSGQKIPSGVYVVKVLARSVHREDREYKYARIITLIR